MLFLYFQLMKNNPIGIFDSGIGGLTVANAIKKVLPNEDFIYFGDTEHLPYGEKSKESILRFSKNIIKFLINKECKAIVIACNSASSVMNDNLLNYANNKIMFNVIDPVAKLVVEMVNGRKSSAGETLEVGVIGTKATIGSKIYTKKIEEISCDFNCGYSDDPENTKTTSYYVPNIKSLATPLLAPMIEEGFINDEISKKVIQNYLSDPILENIDMLILACTHYPLIYNKINEYYTGEKIIIDSSEIVAKHIESVLKKKNLLNNKVKTNHQFYVSNYTKSFEQSTRFFFKEGVKLEEVNIHQ